MLLGLLKDVDARRTVFLLDRIHNAFHPSMGESVESDPLAPPPAWLESLRRCGGDPSQAAFELVSAMFDTSRLPDGLRSTVDVMQKGRDVARRAMDVLVDALLSPACREDDAAFDRLVHDSLFHSLQSQWGESCGKGEGRRCKEYVASLCCRLVHRDAGSAPLAVRGAFAVLVEVVRLFPRVSYAVHGDITREACIYSLQKEHDIIGACMASLRSLSAEMSRKDMDSEAVLGTELWTRLLQLRYLVENCADREYTLTLDVHQVDALWEALKGPTEACLRWLRLASDSGGILGDRAVGHLFRAHLCRVDPSTLGPHGFNCYQALFADLQFTAGVLDI